MTILRGGISGANLGTLMSNQYNQGYQDYEEKMKAAADAQQNALQASVDSAVADLNAQKDAIGRNTESNNAAAEKAYMTAINPNGSMAENLAAQGLLSTGNTESSQISAGNTYQNALNNNATTATEALAEIERAITQARLNGDIQKANALADLYKEVAGKQLDNVSNMISLCSGVSSLASVRPSRPARITAPRRLRCVSCRCRKSSLRRICAMHQP